MGAKGEALRVKKALEGEINELEIGLDHANKANSEGLKSVKRYQGQLKETIQLYEDEARSRSQIMEQVGISERKAYQRAERKCKELVFSSGEDKKNQDRMTDLASKLQSKIKTYKQQIEEAEEIAALNLAKFRKAQQELEEVEERAKLAALL